MKKFCRLIIVLFACVGFCQVAIAQTDASLQRVTLTSVTLSIDSVETAEEMDLIRTTVKAYPQVRDFDIKYGNCDFTLDNSGQALENILVDLDREGFVAAIYRVNENQTFTLVPEESCMPGGRQKPDMSEQEVIEKGITRGTPPPKTGR